MSDSIGRILKEARDQKGLSIEQISQLTHIKIRFLEALENDQLDLIPSPVQTKGFIRLISDQVGINPQPLIDIVTGKTRPVEPADSETPTSLAATDITLPVAAPVHSGLTGTKKKPARVNSIPAEYTQPIPLDPSQPEPFSTVIFKDIGQTIRKRRETLGLSLPDVEDYIHVRVVYLQQIEEGRLSELPSTVQARGMLNNYLAFLDLDSEKIMLKFADGVQSLYAERTLNQKIETKKSKQVIIFQPGWKRYFTTDLLVGSIVIVAILGFSILGAIQISSLPEKPTAPSGDSISDVLIVTLPAKTGTALANNSKLSPLDQNAAGASGNNSISAQITSTTIFSGKGPVQINVISSQRAYMRVIVDGKSIFDGRVLPGNAYPYSGDQQIEFLTGNAGAIKLAYLMNGQQTDLGILGSNGEVKSLIFTKQGMFTPTPRFTPSPTGTSLPSITPTITTTPEAPTITPYIPQQ